MRTVSASIGNCSSQPRPLARCQVKKPEALAMRHGRDKTASHEIQSNLEQSMEMYDRLAIAIGINNAELGSPNSAR